MMTTGPGAGEEESRKESKKGSKTLPIAYYLQLSVLLWDHALFGAICLAVLTAATCSWCKEVEWSVSCPVFCNFYTLSYEQLSL